MTRGRRVGGKEYLFTWATRLFYSRNSGDESRKSVRRIKPSSLPKKFRLKVVENAGSWVRKTSEDVRGRKEK